MHNGKIRQGEPISSLNPLFTPCYLPHFQVVETELQERARVLSGLEADSQDLARFVSSGEAARIKARLTQIGRYWDELRESVQQLDGQLRESFSHQRKFSQSFQEVP